ncbi:hypothetical protein, partial [Rhizobium sp. Rhizsp42]|uniref:hypothetical protein n=1 Tax=Rhizobium sp. Rhizsp42 TaxID=3243034 RepID=UPI0039AF4ABC
HIFNPENRNNVNKPNADSKKHMKLPTIHQFYISIVAKSIKKSSLKPGVYPLCFFLYFRWWLSVLVFVSWARFFV